MIEEKNNKNNKNLTTGRVVCVLKNLCYIESEGKKIKGKVSGKFIYKAFNKCDYPVVGDYVNYRTEKNSETAIVEKVLERYSEIARFDEFNTNKEVIVSNVDIIFVAMSLNKDFNYSKLQNFLTLAYVPNTKIIVLLTKKDLCSDIEEKIAKVRTLSEAYEICPVTIFEQESIDKVLNLIGQKTAVFLGSSGVGKSALINKLFGQEYFKTGDIRKSDSQGKHTTTHREMLELSTGGHIIDTPGIRNVFSSKIEDVDNYYEDIEMLKKSCRFRNCTHTNEPGCKILEAVRLGELTEERLKFYEKVVRYNNYIEKKENNSDSKSWKKHNRK